MKNVFCSFLSVVLIAISSVSSLAWADDYSCHISVVRNSDYTCDNGQYYSQDVNLVRVDLNTGAQITITSSTALCDDGVSKADKSANATADEMVQKGLCTIKVEDSN